MITLNTRPIVRNIVRRIVSAPLRCVPPRRHHDEHDRGETSGATPAQSDTPCVSTGTCCRSLNLSSDEQAPLIGPAEKYWTPPAVIEGVLPANIQPHG